MVGQPFASGDILCLRRFPRSSFGPSYDSVWHRSPAGTWTVYTTIAPELSCPRFIGAEVSRAVEAAIEIVWSGPFELAVRVPSARLEWRMRMASTPVTRLMNLMMALMPSAFYRSNRILALMSAISTLLLGAGRFRLWGRTPNRQWFQAGPRKIWVIPEARATIEGRDLGAPGPLTAQATVGDFVLPQRGLFMLGGMSFEAYSPARHLRAVAGAA